MALSGNAARSPGGGVMKVLIVGGSGLISMGIVKHLLARKARISVFNRGKRDASIHPDIEQITGDRNEETEFERAFADRRFDAVIDMICFTAKQAESSVRAFAGRCDHFIFCSTVCTYGVDIPRRVGQGRRAAVPATGRPGVDSGNRAGRSVKTIGIPSGLRKNKS